MSAGFYITVHGVQYDTNLGKKNTNDYPYELFSYRAITVYSNVDLRDLRVKYRTGSVQGHTINYPTGDASAQTVFWKAAAERIEYYLKNSYKFYVDTSELIFFKPMTTGAELDFEINQLKRELSSLRQR